MAYNRAVGHKCGLMNTPTFDTFAITQNSTSFDGVHYGLVSCCASRSFHRLLKCPAPLSRLIFSRPNFSSISSRSSRSINSPRQGRLDSVSSFVTISPSSLNETRSDVGRSSDAEEPFLFSNKCSHENISLAAKGSGPDLPICPHMLESIATARRESRDGPVLMQTADGSQPCTFQWFRPNEICTMLSHPPTTIAYVGDSMTRHAMHGMQLLVRDNIEHGALR